MKDLEKNSNVPMNSKEYWDGRFEGDWEENRGKEQTRFFTELAIRHLPQSFKKAVNRYKLGILDWGCAEGDAVGILEEAFPDSEIAGLDISEAGIRNAKACFPKNRFICGALTEREETFDIIFSSNCLEHFEKPYEILDELISYTNEYLILLLPFQEYDRIEEHFVTFDFDFFPFRLKDFALTFFYVIDTSEDENQYWIGKQILLIFARNNAKGLEEAKFSLADSVDDLGKLLRKKTEELNENILLLEKREREIQSHLHTIRARDKVISDILNSRSWRTTAPLRKLAKLAHPHSSRLKAFIERRFLVSVPAYAFLRFKEERAENFAPTMRSLHCPNEPGLVSIVMPVYNGERYVREALDSVLAQRYENFELIAIDDGSTDNTPKILDDYAGKDQRIRVIHQENQKLPRSLSRGFREARGEYLTWTSDDNLLRPDFLQKMVDCLRRHPDRDMAYANLDMIDDEGRLLEKSLWWSGDQRPPGSGHVVLPETASELNTVANNSIGAAFLYRNRIAYLLGDYCRHRFTLEDYDYWMRVNSLFNIRRADFEEPVYEYRFHEKSLTTLDADSEITRKREQLMVFDDFRRDFYLSPMIWHIEDEDSSEESRRLSARLREKIENAGHLILDSESLTPEELPRLWTPSVYVRIASAPSESDDPPADLPKSTTKVFLAAGKSALPNEMKSDWDLCIAADDIANPPRLTESYQGWLCSGDIDQLFTSIDIRSKSRNIALLEDETENPEPAAFKVSVIICTYKRTDKLIQAVQSAANQSLPKSDYEVIIVNNDYENREIYGEIDRLRSECFKEYPENLRLVVCPLLGLSYARNAGIGEARGEVLYFLDDDAIALSNVLKDIYRAYREHPQTGVAGGDIELKAPEPRPAVLKPEREPYWGHLISGYSEYREVTHWGNFPWGGNWSALREALFKVGGFRVKYGRRGKDFAGGEEIVAASLIQRLGYAVAMVPSAKALHDVSPDRFTLEYVRKTIQAGIFTIYQAQRDLIITARLGPLNTLSKIVTLSLGIAKRSAQNALAGNEPEPEPGQEPLIDRKYRLQALNALLSHQISDFFKKMSLRRRLR